MTRRTPNLVAAAIQPLFGLMWPLFLAWTALVFGVVVFGLGQAEIVDWIPGGTTTGGLSETPPAPVEAALILVLKTSDAIWWLLAGVNTYLALVASEGLTTARRWAAIILIGSSVLAWTGVVTGVPFGPLVFTDVLGLRIGHVLPFTIPLVWLVIVIGGRTLVLRFFPQVNKWLLASAVAGIAFLTDLNIEPIAWKVRAYWIWYPLNFAPPPHPPLQNYLSWAVGAFVFSLALGENKQTVVRRVAATRPIAILALMNLVYLVGNLVRWLLP